MKERQKISRSLRDAWHYRRERLGQLAGALPHRRN